MNSGTAKSLRKMVSNEPSKSFLDETSAIHGEDKVLNGEVDLYKIAKKLWTKKSHKEKETAWII